MLETTLRVRCADVEGVLDDLLPALPGGVHVRDSEDQVDLRIIDAPGVPDRDALRRLLGERLIELSSAEVSDDWRQRRRERYEPLLIADRFLVRPDWAPPGSSGPGRIEIVLAPSAAFGTGLHPTTAACLAALAAIEAPKGSFADLGCGSGLLSIAAARLGFTPVLAVDLDPESVLAAGSNARRNGVEIEVRQGDVTREAPPPARTIAANIPPAVQVQLAAALREPPASVIASGFHPEAREEVAAAWGAHGLAPIDELMAGEWSVLVLG